MIYDEIISNLSNIIGNNNSSENVYNTFEFAEKAIQNKKIDLEINPNINSELNYKMNNTILGGAYFRENEAGIASLVFGKKYLDSYHKDSTIHYTILMHEFKHINDYFHNKTSMFNSNEKEKFFYELSAVQIEAEFIKYYLSGNFDLIKCENYILKSYENDNLDSWTISNIKASAYVYRILNDIEIEYKQKIITEEHFLNELAQKSDLFLTKCDVSPCLFDIYKENIDNFARFGHFIRLKTFYKYLNYIYKEYPEIKEICLNNSEFIDRYNKIINLISQNDRIYKFYSDCLNKYYEKDLENRC